MFFGGRRSAGGDDERERPCGGDPATPSQTPGQGPRGPQGQGQNLGQGPADRIGGRVTAVNGNTISVQNSQGSFEITTNASTQFTASGQSASLADVQVGKFVGVRGHRQSDGSWTATDVMISDRSPARPGPIGSPARQGQPPFGGSQNGS